MVALALRGVWRGFGRGPAVLRDLSIEVLDHELLVLLGPSGSGKSTLLRIVCGLEAPDRGDVEIDGRSVVGVPPARRDVAFVPEHGSLYPHLTVRQNLETSLRPRRRDRSAAARRVEETARTLGLLPLLERRPHELSAGERQRAALGRALGRRARLVLLDEPLSRLDAARRDALRREIRRVHELTAATTVLVTHDPDEAMAIGDRIAVLGDGRVLQVGRPLDVYDHPASAAVARSLGRPRTNLLAGHVIAEDGRPVFHAGPLRIELRADLVPSVGGAHLLGVRPEHVELTDAGTEVVVESVERLGDRTIVRLRAGDLTLVAASPGRPPVEVGDRRALRLARENLLLFDAVTGAPRRPPPRLELPPGEPEP